VAQALLPVRFSQSSQPPQIACSKSPETSKAPRQECLCYSSAREERADRNRPEEKGESKIRKPAPLNTARVRHPKFQNRIKAWPPATRCKKHCSGILRLDNAFVLLRATRQLRVILSEAKNLSVTVIAMRNTTERFFASLRMTASGAGAHKTLNGLRLHQCHTLEHHKVAPPENSKSLKGCATRQADLATFR
jgi:hypothetical protein